MRLCFVLWTQITTGGPERRVHVNSSAPCGLCSQAARPSCPVRLSDGVSELCFPYLFLLRNWTSRWITYFSHPNAETTRPYLWDTTLRDTQFFFFFSGKIIFDTLYGLIESVHFENLKKFLHKKEIIKLEILEPTSKQQNVSFFLAQRCTSNVRFCLPLPRHERNDHDQT